MTTGETRLPKPRTAYLSMLLINMAAFPLTAIIAINAAHEILENGGYPDARYGQDDTNLLICYCLFGIIAIPLVITSFIVLLGKRQLTRLSAWGAALGALFLPPLTVFFILVQGRINLG
jgi:hypothetical protein